MQTFRIWTYLSYYFIGGLFKRLRASFVRKVSLSINVVLVIIMTTAINFYQYNIGLTVYETVLAEYFYNNILTFFWVFSIVLLVSRAGSLKAKTLAMLSNNIMGIYILHTIVILAFEKIVPQYFKYSLQNTILIIGVFMCSLILSFAINKMPILNKTISV